MSNDVYDGAVEFLAGICAISSPSGDVPGLTRAAERVAEQVEPFSLTPEIRHELGIDGQRQPVLLARGPDADDRFVLLIGHLDTVLPAVPPRLGDDRLEGTGALDMKGGFAALCGALETLRASGARPPEDLVLLAVPDEEVGGPISEKMVHEFGTRARTVIVLEPGEVRESSETLVSGRRGLTVWRLDGRGRAAHSGLAYWEGRSALAAAAGWSAEVQRLSERSGGPLVNVGRIVGGDSEFVQDLGEEHHFIGTSQRLNVVPDRCIVEGEVRYLSIDDGERTLARMRRTAGELAERWGVELVLEEVERIPPVNPSGPGARLAERLVAAAERDGWTLEIERDRGGVSFPNFLPDPSAVPVLDGLGPGGGGMHTREEYLDLRSLRRRIALIAEVLLLLREE